MLIRIDVAPKAGQADVVGLGVKSRIKEFFGLDVESVRCIKTFTVDGLDEAQGQALLDAAALHDPVLHEASLSPLAGGFDFALEVGFKPGVTDNEGRTARETIRLVTGQDAKVYTSTQYLFSGGVDRKTVEHLALDLLANVLIQRIEIKSAAEWTDKPGFAAKAAQVVSGVDETIAVAPLSTMDDEALAVFSRDNTLALSLEEMLAIKAYYADQTVQELRAGRGLPADPTDAEIECLAQTWSEHCKHKIFNATITHADQPAGTVQTIEGLFPTYIRQTTVDVRKRLGKQDFCLSVFKDNAGVIAFDADDSICVKVETHNSPSALDPYGGALTGIVGVNRDPMGTGIGAEMLCNTNVFCFASPYWAKPLPPRLLHPRRVFEGVREGVEHGGNKSGVPTVNGSIVFHDRFLGKPLVFCGTIGLAPRTINGKPSHEKRANIGDHVVMVGGRIGKDGIHGATFSSEELHEGSPATAVQIGDPITQKKMYDFVIRARNLGLYSAITDNGAGGLSSSVGEMAGDTGGVEIDLKRAPLKYDGLRPWEILLSEAQERMTLAVPPESLAAFLDLAKEMDVEASELGRFNDSGFFSVRCGDKQAALLDMAFLHDGAPIMRLDAEWTGPGKGFVETGSTRVNPVEHGFLLKKMLGRLNVCSKEYVVRRYDHEVKGGSVIKPLVGAKADGPADAAVLRPRLDKTRGLVVSHGLCPKFSDFDAYWMAANAVDEAVRGAVAAGANPRLLAGVDNFCWCDPVVSDRNPDGKYKLAQLVRANQALAHYCKAFGVPLVSGKDSMKNDYLGGGVKISVPPTLLVTVIGVVEHVGRAVSSDFKRPGERIYLLGATGKDLGGSEYDDHMGGVYARCPEVDALSAALRYKTLHEAMLQGLVSACHDCSDGGLGVALAEMAIGGRLGCRIDLDLVPLKDEAAHGMSDAEILYAESASRLVVAVPLDKAGAFEALFAGQVRALLGVVLPEPTFVVKRRGEILLNEPLHELVKAWKATLDW